MIKVASKKKPGDKLHAESKLEKLVVRMINDEPSISDYKIAGVLREQYKFKITSPSIKTWRKEWYKKLKDQEPEYEEIITDKDKVDISKFHEISIDKMSNILETVKILKELETCLERVKGNFSVKIEEVTNPDGTKTEAMTFFDKEKEDVYRGYINEIIKVRKAIDSMLGDINIYKLVKEEILGFVKSVVFRSYDPTDKEKFEIFKKESELFDTSLRQKYLVKF